MATLTTKQRKAEPKSDFGIPSTRSYPMPDANHARDAEGRAKQALDSGRISKSQYDHIIAMAHRKLGE
jgi:hypothetical protein